MGHLIFFNGMKEWGREGWQGVWQVRSNMNVCFPPMGHLIFFNGMKEWGREGWQGVWQVRSNMNVCCMFSEFQHFKHQSTVISVFCIMSQYSPTYLLCIHMAQSWKNLLAMQETWVQSLGWEDPLEKGMATHSSILAWWIPQTEQPGGLQSMGSQRVRHD